MKRPRELSTLNDAKPHPSPADAGLQRQALARVYALLIGLLDEQDNALSGNFGEETEKALEQTPTEVEACND